MASAPFTLTITSPGDTDIVSQFPALDRSDKDVLQSWLLTDHNANGTHKSATFLQVGVADSNGQTASVPSPATNNSAIYRDTDGALKVKRGDDSSVEFLGGVPPGTVVYYAGSTVPTGWYAADGTAKSRTGDARLFTAIGILYGAGDGSTTFNLPDINARVIIGQDRASTGRVTTTYAGFNGATLGATGGSENFTLGQTNIPNYNLSASGLTVAGSISVSLNPVGTFLGYKSNQPNAGAGGNNPLRAADDGALSVDFSLSASGSINSGGSSSPKGHVMPAIVLMAIIKR